MKLTIACLVILFVLLQTQQGFSKTKSSDALDSDLQQKNYLLLLRIVSEGGHRGLKECQRQFQNEIWNCSLGNSVYQELPIFVKTTLPHATRETAFVHAISSAAITHEITLQCAKDKVPGCRCAETRKQPGGTGDWQWGGCSDNIKFGEKETRRFIDTLEKGNNGRAAFNLHNNAVGRKIVRASLQKECKCHGVTGSCNLKTCWEQLVNFGVIGSALKQKYRTAVPVSFHNRNLHKRDINSNRYSLVTRKDTDLVYLESSPDYCVRNTTAGTTGILGRTCTNEGGSTKECKSLCKSCNLRPRSEEHYKQVKCMCKFVWCCTVKCEMCIMKYSLTTCRN